MTFFQESFREFITFFQNFNRVTHSSHSVSDELGAPFSPECALCITLSFRKTQFYRKFVTLPIVILIKLFSSRKNVEIDLLKTIFFLLGIIASCTVLIVGISYTDATGFFAVCPPYLAGGYPIILVFDMLSFFIAWNIVANLLKRRTNVS